MGNVPPQMIYASVCAEFLLEVAKGGAMEGGVMVGVQILV